jgi:hypothetical protein
MSEAKAAWDDVGNRFNDLARHLKDRYDANAAFGAADREKVNDALRQLGDALDAGFTAVGDSLRDQEMRDEMKEAGAAIGRALSSTFNELSGKLSSRSTE